MKRKKKRRNFQKIGPCRMCNEESLKKVLTQSDFRKAASFHKCEFIIISFGLIITDRGKDKVNCSQIANYCQSCNYLQQLRG